MKLKNLPRNNIILLACLLALIILFPLFKERDPLVRDLLLTAIFFSGIFSLDFSTQSLKILLPLGTATAATTWIGYFVHNDFIALLDFITTFLFLVAIVVLLIRHIARSRDVNRTIILSSINGYLLLGLLSAVLLAIADLVHQHIFASGAPAINFPVALEGALKLKEISYIHAEGYPAAEMKHGPIALIDENMPVVVVALKDAVYDKVLSNIQEIKARSGRVVAVVTEGDDTVCGMVDHCIEIPPAPGPLTPLLSILPLQLLAYHMAVLRGCDVDQPRNLAKSVTVE